MEKESRRQANVWAAKLGLSLSDFCAQAIASECVSRDLAELDEKAAKRTQKEPR
jgi:hypothetical protein